MSDRHNGFPHFERWCDEVINGRDKGGGTWTFNTQSWYDHYERKHRIAKMLKPASILEIGVRYGYSAHAFLSACDDHVPYTGIDSDNPAHNAMGEPTCDWAAAMLERTCGNPVRIIRTDTQQAPTSPVCTGFDLVHIDAAHHFHGALRDMIMFWPLCRKAMLVDDYDGTSSVRDAVAAFLKRTGSILFTTTSNTGEALIVR